MTKAQVGSAVAENGKRGNGFLDISSTSDGFPVKTPVIILQGTKPGPALWVQGCIHGNEYCGSLGILQTCREVNPEEMAGTLIALPALNITAFLEERRFSPYSYYGVPDLNRVFPGNPLGNFTEIMAHHIFSTFVEKADYLIDFHGGHNPDTYWTLYSEDGSETAKKSCDLAKAFGIEMIWPAKSELLKNGMFAQAAKHQKPAIIVEAGGFGELAEPQAVETVASGIKNVMRHLKILNQPVTWKERYLLFKDWTWMSTPHGGRFATTLKPGDSVKAGQIIARMFTIFDAELPPVKSPVDGIVLAITRKPFVVAGDSMIQIGIP